MRKYNKNEYVNVYTPNGAFLGTGKIDSWEYYRITNTYDYKVVNIKVDNPYRWDNPSAWFEEGHLENLKILLTREDPDKMQIFYQKLKDLNIDVSFQHNEKKETYTLIGKDLHIAKDLFQTILRTNSKENTP